MILKSGYRFSEKHALGLDPGDHAPPINEGEMPIRRKRHLALRHWRTPPLPKQLEIRQRVSNNGRLGPGSRLRGVRGGSSSPCPAARMSVVRGFFAPRSTDRQGAECPDPTIADDEERLGHNRR